MTPPDTRALTLTWGQAEELEQLLCSLVTQAREGYGYHFQARRIAVADDILDALRRPVAR